MFNYTISTSIIDILTVISITVAILVIVSKNPVLSVLFLIALFSTISVYLMQLGLQFIGLSYLLVYVGAVSILFLFILMLINIRVSELITDNKNSIPLAIIIAFILQLMFSYETFPQTSNTDITYDKINYNIGESLSHKIYFANSSSWDNALLDMSHIASIGNILYISYPVLLILTSVILLLAMVGVIIITKDTSGNTK